MPSTRNPEINEILQGLNKSWPDFGSLTWSVGAVATAQRDALARYLSALQWLTDMGMITFEAMSVEPPALSIRQAALTSRGRNYIQENLRTTADPDR